MNILAVDPGLDATGLALFALPEPPAGGQRLVTFQRAIEAVTDLRVLRTTPQTPMPERLAALHQALVAYGAAHPVALVVLEHPATEGAYAERRRRQYGKGGINAKALAPFNQAYGVLQAAAVLTGAAVARWPAIALPKPKRHHLVREAGKHAPAGHPVAVLIGKLRASPDLLDAVYLGASALAAGVLQRVPAA